MIQLHNVSWQTNGTAVLRDVSLEIPTGKYAMLMGPTGCGKTTLLELICGLRRAHSGKIVLDGNEVTHMEPRDRKIGYLPQDLALFPGKTVRAQIAFGPSIKGEASHEDIQHTVEELAKELGIHSLLDRLPDNLSGGEKQRVALARALAANPRVLLLDEPLSALDENTRAEAAKLLGQLQLRHHLTVLHVTHSEAEARALGQLHFRFAQGKLIQTA